MGLGRITLIFFINFLLIFSLVYAVDISTQGVSGELCPRETGLFTHLVSNNGDVARDYVVNLRGSASGWSTGVPGGFSLQPGMSRNIFTYVTPTQGVNPGAYGLDIEVVSPGDSMGVSHQVVVKDCYGANIVATPSSANSCPGQTLRFSVRVVNSGEYPERFALGLAGGIYESVSLSDELLMLNPGENREVFVFVEAPEETGEYGFSVIVESESGRVRESLPIFLTVDPCYDFTLAISGNNTYSICDNSYLAVPINLRNDGTNVNSYRISVDGPEWAKVEKSDFVLQPNGARSFNLIFDPEYGVSGDHEIELQVIPESGSLKAISVFDVEVRACHSVDVEFLDEEVDACKGATNNFKALVTNNGESKRSFKLELTSPPWFSLSESDRVLTLDAAEQKNITLTAVPTSDVPKRDYDMTLKISAVDESSVASNDKDVLDVNVKSIEDCYEPRIEVEYDDLVIYFDSSVAVPVEIRNEGLRVGEYSLFLSGNAATFANLNPTLLSVEPGKSETVYLYIAPGVDVELGDYDASIALNLKEGPLLDSKLLNIEITDNRERVTSIDGVNVVDTNETVVREGAWTRFKGWFWRNFVENKVETNYSVAPVAQPTTDLETPNYVSIYKYYIIGAIILVLLVVLVIQFGLAKKALGFFLEDEKVKKNRKDNLKKELENIKGHV